MAPGVKYKHKDFYPSYVKVLFFCDAYRQFFGRVCTKKCENFTFTKLVFYQKVFIKLVHSDEVM